MSKFVFKIEEYRNNCIDIIFDEQSGSGILINVMKSPRKGFVSDDEDKIQYEKFCKRLNIQFF